ncbi:MAG: tripartite tricarboxylate transporter substrate binding protein [Rubrivivax sp.]|nr:tripartite tricarboxylate transporter substrate binding protein [Burkholderiales bacterium]MCW5633464.1 tripartite tricarboxylate transporter substrate binding protein [Rubrivivax sp.]
MNDRAAMTMLRLAACLLALALPAVAAAEDYPARPIRIVVPTAPGGFTDTVVQLLSERFRSAWGQPAVMEHKAGAGGIVGTDFVAKAAPDGYTLLAGNIGPIVITPLLQQGKVPYDADRDLVPVKILATFGNVLVVNPAVPAHSLEELIRLARARPGTLHFASAGNGQSQHLSGELFKRLAGVDIVHVPYKGTGPALTDLIGGQVQMMFSNLPPALPHIEAGKLRPLAVTGPRRAGALPAVPTLEEAGLAGYQVVSWVALFAPAGTPPAIVARLHAEVTQALESPAGRQRIAAGNAEPGAGSAHDLTALVAADRAKWGKVIREGNIRAE